MFLGVEIIWIVDTKINIYKIGNLPFPSKVPSSVAIWNPVDHNIFEWSDLVGYEFLTGNI